MTYCADTNILLRWAQPQTEQSRQAYAAVKEIHKRGETVSITPQNLVEFWAVATRPANVNGLGLTPTQAEAEMTKLERLFPLLPDTAAIHAEWKAIVATHQVSGVHTHDARLAATLRVHGITHILTFNTGDFLPFGQPVAVHPAELVQGAA